VKAPDKGAAPSDRPDTTTEASVPSSPSVPPRCARQVDAQQMRPGAGVVAAQGHGPHAAALVAAALAAHRCAAQPDGGQRFERRLHLRRRRKHRNGRGSAAGQRRRVGRRRVRCSRVEKILLYLYSNP
jgi:hypothetical protein